MCYNVKYLKRVLTLEKIEDKIIKAIEKRNIHNKNYFWIVSILILSIIIIIYSYQTDTGIIAKQTINKELVVKNQENLKQLYKENKMASNTLAPIEEKIAPIHNETIKQRVTEENPTNAVEEVIIPQEKEIAVKENASEQTVSIVEEKITPRIVAIKNEPEHIPTVVKPVETVQPQKTQEVVQEKISVEEKKIAALDNKQTTLKKVIEPKTSFTLTHCYEFEPAKYTFVSSCQKELDTFIQNNAEALRYEIIGLIDVEDVKNLSNKGEINQGILAKNRIIAVQEFLKNKTQIPLSDHFYYLKSELPMRGFVLRAYF